MVASVGLLALGGSHLPRASAQTNRPVTIETDLVKDPGGVPLLHVAKGTALAIGPAKGGWTQATIEGWIVASALRDDKRDGFDVSVSLASGATMRDKPGSGPALAFARLGALFDKVELKSGWMHVKRTGWIAQSAFTSAPATPPAASSPAPTRTAAVPPPPAAGISVVAGSAIATQLGGATVATLETPVHADVVERKNGWTHVRLDAWVRDASLSNASASNGITAADIRLAPDKYVGQTVEWTVQLIGIQKADDLRPELPAGQPYLLARGPLPEAGFVYIAVTAADAEVFRKLDPLAKIKIRATIRAGKSRFLPTPVLNFVRRLDPE